MKRGANGKLAMSFRLPPFGLMTQRPNVPGVRLRKAIQSPSGEYEPTGVVTFPSRYLVNKRKAEPSDLMVATSGE